MSPETPDKRLNDLERDVALLGQRFDDLRSRVSDLAVMATTVTRLEVAASNLHSEIARIRHELEDRDREASADRRGTRTAIWGMTGAIIATIVGAIITLLIATGGHP